LDILQTYQKEQRHSHEVSGRLFNFPPSSYIFVSSRKFTPKYKCYLKILQIY
jgi:hypothetical protein